MRSHLLKKADLLPDLSSITTGEAATTCVRIPSSELSANPAGVAESGLLIATRLG